MFSIAWRVFEVVVRDIEYSMRKVFSQGKRLHQDSHRATATSSALTGQTATSRALHCTLAHGVRNTGAKMQVP